MTTSEKLMDASERLARLSGRAKQAEDQVAAAGNQARGDVEESARKARASSQAHSEELREAADVAGARVSASWNDTQRSWLHHVATMRQNISAKKAELDANRAEGRAEDAEADALLRSTTRMRPSRRRNPPCSTPSPRGWMPTASPRPEGEPRSASAPPAPSRSVPARRQFSRRLRAGGTLQPLPGGLVRLRLNPVSSRGGATGGADSP
jgi:hypothetical protein